MENPTPPPPLKKRFLIDDMYDQFLKNIGMDKRKMPTYKIQETKKFFFGALGQYMVWQADYLTALSKDEIEATVNDVMKQLETFFANQNEN